MKQKFNVSGMTCSGMLGACGTVGKKGKRSAVRIRKSVERKHDSQLRRQAVQ